MLYVVITTKGGFMDYKFLSETNLFRGLSEDDIKNVLPCLRPVERSYKKNEIVLNRGDVTDKIGMVLKGGVNIFVASYWGQGQIFGHVNPGEIFAENYAAIPGKELLCDVIANQDSEILFFDFSALIKTCQKSCPYHNELILNLIRIAARKNLLFSNRMIHTSSKSIRGRISSYLSEQATINNSNLFSIPFNRQELADYLNVDRSALSNELSKMQSEGLLEFYKNSFKLNKK